MAYPQRCLITRCNSINTPKPQEQGVWNQVTCGIRDDAKRKSSRKGAESFSETKKWNWKLRKRNSKGEGSFGQRYKSMGWNVKKKEVLDTYWPTGLRIRVTGRRPALWFPWWISASRAYQPEDRGGQARLLAGGQPPVYVSPKAWAWLFPAFLPWNGHT